MKRRIYKWLLIAFIAFTPNAVWAQTELGIVSHTMTIAGTSNMHDWTADVETVAGTIKAKIENGKITDILDASITIDAQSLKSSGGSIMNSKINDALNSKKNPKISFKLSKVDKITESAGSYRVSAMGVLSLAGAKQNVSLDVVGRLLPNGSIEFTGIKKLKMTDYKVEPPTAMFGAMTTGDEVTLTFKVILQTKQLTSNNN